MLPGIDGFEILKRIREKGIKTPVLLLTALDGIEDRVKGLDYGADDYLVKPFAFDELMARIRVLLRRNSTNGNSNAQGTNTKLGQRLANTGTTETNTGLAGLGLGILGGLLAAARRRKNDKN